MGRVSERLSTAAWSAQGQLGFSPCAPLFPKIHNIATQGVGLQRERAHNRHIARAQARHKSLTESHLYLTSACLSYTWIDLGMAIGHVCCTHKNAHTQIQVYTYIYTWTDTCSC